MDGTASPGLDEGVDEGMNEWMDGQRLLAITTDDVLSAFLGQEYIYVINEQHSLLFFKFLLVTSLSLSLKSCISLSFYPSLSSMEETKMF